jgi:hypothetical protein
MIMANFLAFINVVTKIFIFIKFSYLLIMTAAQPDNFPVSSLTWWGFFILFDIWIMQATSLSLQNAEKVEQEKSE